MGREVKKSRLAEIPAWVLSLLALFVSFGIWAIFTNIELPKPIDSDIVIFVFYTIFLCAASFTISWTHPNSFWYTPFIINAMIIYILIILLIHYPSQPDIWGLISCASWIVLSVVGAIIGARMGRRRKLSKQNN